MVRLADRGICLDVCPTSNVMLSVVGSFEEHPLPALLDAGVRCRLMTARVGASALFLLTNPGHPLGARSAHFGERGDSAERQVCDATDRPSGVGESPSCPRGRDGEQDQQLRACP